MITVVTAIVKVTTSVVTVANISVWAVSTVCNVVVLAMRKRFKSRHRRDDKKVVLELFDCGVQSDLVTNCSSGCDQTVN